MEINGSKHILVCLLITLNANNVLLKVYDECNLAQELISKDKAFFRDINTWLCIIKGESSYNTSAHHRGNWDQSDDHGLFQINDRYWCDPGNGKKTANVCSLSCHKLRDDDITDDILCAKRIFQIHGFNAWAVYPNCKKQALNINKFFHPQCNTSYLNGKHLIQVQNKKSRTSAWIPPKSIQPNPFSLNNYPNLLLNEVDTQVNNPIIREPKIIPLLLVNNNFGYIIGDSNPIQKHLLYYYI